MEANRIFCFIYRNGHFDEWWILNYGKNDSYSSVKLYPVERVF